LSSLPLTYSFQLHRDKCSPHQFRYLELIEQFSTDFRHISGQDNVVADVLSRAYSVMSRLDYHALANSQEWGTELQDIPESGPELRLECVPIPGTDIRLYLTNPSPQSRPFITTSFRRQVFDTLHGLSHPGTKATFKLMSQRFVWPGVGKDCRAWIRACTPCQCSYVTQHLKAFLGKFSSLRQVSLMSYRPGRPALFLFCPPVLSHFTLWPEALPPSEVMAEAVSKAFVSVWVSRTGSSHQITTDQDSQFKSRLVKTLGTIKGSTLSRTTAWHPASNDIIERIHRHL